MPLTWRRRSRTASTPRSSTAAVRKRISSSSTPSSTRRASQSSSRTATGAPPLAAARVTFPPTTRLRPARGTTTGACVLCGARGTAINSWCSIYSRRPPTSGVRTTARIILLQSGCSTSGDVSANFNSVLNNLKTVYAHAEKGVSYPGCWAYPDMLGARVVSCTVALVDFSAIASRSCSYRTSPIQQYNLQRLAFATASATHSRTLSRARTSTRGQSCRRR